MYSITLIYTVSMYEYLIETTNADFNFIHICYKHVILVFPHPEGKRE